MKNILVLLSCLLLGLTTKSFAQGKEVWKDVPYPKEANGNIKCIETDPQGNVWVGTEHGSLLKFDGKTWTSIDLNSCVIEKFKSKALGSIQTIFFDINNSIWVGTSLSTFYFDGTKWDCLINSKLTNFVGYIRKFHRSGNTIWMYHTQNIFKYENNKWTIFSMIPYQFRLNRLNGIYKDISEVDPLDTIRYDIDTNLTIPGGQIYDFDFDKDGNLWYATGEKGVVKYDGTSWINYTKSNSTIPYDWVLRIKNDKQGRLWCGANQSGICVLENGIWEIYSDTNNFDASSEGDNVESIFPDNSGNIWIGLFGGIKHKVIKFTGKSYKVYNETKPTSFGDDLLITADKNGTKWIASKFDLFIRTLSDGSGAFYTYKPKLTGKIYYDKNKNHQKDNDEAYLANHKVKVQSTNQIAFSNSQGEYTLSLDYGTYAIKYLAEGYWSAVKDSTYTVNLNDSVTNLPEIGVYAPEVTALERNISLGANRCGFDVPLYFTCRNSGTTEINGTISISLDTSIHVKYATPMYDSIRNNKLYFNLAKLPCGTERQINIGMTMPNFTHMGENLRYTSNVHTTNKDFTDTLYRLVKCSYDPNEKEVSPVGLTDKNYTYKNDVLTYTLRFQNVGNDNAVNILVQDTLSKLLDINSFKVVASSHSVNTTLDTTGVANFLFKNILLPDSTTNEKKSHGFVTFTIKRDATKNTLGELKNTGYIYFDYNPAVVTNTTKNTLVDTIIHQQVQVCKGASYTYLDSVKINEVVGTNNHIFATTKNGKSVVMNTTVSPYPDNKSNQTKQLCVGSTLTFGKQTINKPGTYSEVFKSAAGCDSAVFLTVKQDTINTEVGFHGTPEYVSALVSKEKNATYQWIDCDKYVSISGADSNYFEVHKIGSYAVKVTKNGCSDTSKCIEIKTTSLKNVEQKSANIYPNPTEGVMYIETNQSITELVISNIEGKEMLKTTLTNAQKHSIDVRHWATNTYIVRLQSADSVNTFKINVIN